MKLNLEQIPRVKTITKEEFLKQYVALQKPVVIERLILDWPAYKKWSLDYINEVAGEKVVPIYDDRPISSKRKFNEAHSEMKMSAYIDLLKEGPTSRRIFLYNLLREVPHLQNDFKYPEIGLKFMKKLPFLFFGGRGSRRPMDSASTLGMSSTSSSSSSIVVSGIVVSRVNISGVVSSRVWSSSPRGVEPSAHIVDFYRFSRSSSEW